MKKNNIASLFRENIRNLSPYSTARDDYSGGELGVFLDANENPYNNGYNRYPDPHQRLLKEKLARQRGVVKESIFIGNGSDEPIDILFRVFCEPRIDNMVSIAPTYGMYGVAAAINDVEVRQVQLNSDYSLDVNRMMAAVDEQTKLMFICSPNNPTANAFPEREVEQLIEQFDGIVVVDEAYIDFAEGDGFLHKIDKYPNLVVLQTLSKAWGLAGLRFGMAYGNPEIIGAMGRVKYPYNINKMTQKLIFDLLDKDISAQVAEIKSERERVMSELKNAPIIREIYPSDANFILVKVDDPNGVYDALIKQGVIVRNRSRIGGCEGCLRITIGVPEENSKLLEILKGMK